MDMPTLLTHVIYPLIVATWTIMLGLHIKLLTYLIRTVVAVENSLSHHHARLELLEGARKK